MKRTDLNWQEIYDAYVKQSKDELLDFNNAQINKMLQLAYEQGHSSGVSECANMMFDIVSICRDVKGAETKVVEPTVSVQLKVTQPELKVSPVLLTKGELAMLTFVLDKDLLDMMDGWQHLLKQNPEEWNKKYNDLASAKGKMFHAYNMMKQDSRSIK